MYFLKLIGSVSDIFSQLMVILIIIPDICVDEDALFDQDDGCECHDDKDSGNDGGNFDSADELFFLFGLRDQQSKENVFDCFLVFLDFFISFFFSLDEQS